MSPLSLVRPASFVDSKMRYTERASCDGGDPSRRKRSRDNVGVGADDSGGAHRHPRTHLRVATDNSSRSHSIHSTQH